jgi:glycosyltransferase involved in cell wall biosynthesis
MRDDRGQVRISAIIPAFNAEPWLEEAVRSVYAQTSPVFEIIVVNDGSVDMTGDLARSLGCRVVDLAVNSGEGIARNTGIHCATGDVIAWLDADDYWAPRHVEVLVGLLDRFPEAAVACAAVEYVGLRSGVNRGYAPVDAPGNIFWKAVRDWVHPIIGSLIRRQALLDIGGFSTIHGPSVDYDMWLRLAREHLFIATHDVTSYWRWHPHQQSRNLGAQLAAVYRYRRAFLENNLKGRYPDDARRFEELIRYLWKSDFDAGLKQGNIDLCRTLFATADEIPGIGRADIETRQDALQNLTHKIIAGFET